MTSDNSNPSLVPALDPNYDKHDPWAGIGDFLAGMPKSKTPRIKTHVKSPKTTKN